MKIKKKVYEEMLSQYRPVPPEQGGIIGEKDDIVCEYIHDISPKTADRAIYILNTGFLNRCIEDWFERDITFVGVVHSHPVGQNSLSADDIKYISRLFRENRWLGKTYFPLIIGNDVIVYRAEVIGDQLRIQMEPIEILE